MIIKTKYHTFTFHEEGCDATVRDLGDTIVHACPHPNDHNYYVISHRCGYEGRIMDYCREHELAHAVVAEFMTDMPSYVLYNLACKNDKPDMYKVACEEMMAQALQRFARANERPIIGGVDWQGMKDLFLGYLSRAK